MRYEVINYFTDLQDFNHPYNVGDTFPRNGLSVNEERLKELSGKNNKQHKPLIKAVEDEPLPFTDDDITFETKPEEKKYTRTDINRMSKDDLVSLATESGIEGAEEISGSDLKKALIEKFGL